MRGVDGRRGGINEIGGTRPRGGQRKGGRARAPVQYGTGALSLHASSDPALAVPCMEGSFWFSAPLGEPRLGKRVVNARRATRGDVWSARQRSVSAWSALHGRIAHITPYRPPPLYISRPSNFQYAATMRSATLLLLLALGASGEGLGGRAAGPARRGPP